MCLYVCEFMWGGVIYVYMSVGLRGEGLCMCAGVCV